MRAFTAGLMAGCGIIAVAVFMISLRRSTDLEPIEADRTRADSGAGAERDPSAARDLQVDGTRELGLARTEDEADLSAITAGASANRADVDPDEAAGDGEPADERPPVEQFVPDNILAALQSGDAGTLAALDVWFRPDPATRMRLAVAALLTVEEADAAVQRLMALAEVLGEKDPQAPEQLGGAFDTVLGGAFPVPFAGYGDDRRGAAIEALVSIGFDTGSTAAGSFLAWALPGAGAGHESAIAGLVDLAAYHEVGSVRSIALQNLGKIASVERIVDEVAIVIDPAPIDDETLTTQTSFLVGLLRARSRGRTGQEDPTAELLAPRLETALTGWPATPKGSQSTITLLHHLNVHPMPALRPRLEELSQQSTSPVLRSMAERLLRRLPPPEEDPSGSEGDE